MLQVKAFQKLQTQCMNSGTEMINKRKESMYISHLMYRYIMITLQEKHTFETDVLKRKFCATIFTTKINTDSRNSSQKQSLKIEMKISVTELETKTRDGKRNHLD